MTTHLGRVLSRLRWVGHFVLAIRRRESTAFDQEATSMPRLVHPHVYGDNRYPTTLSTGQACER